MRSANRQHERQSFFKYMPLSTAKIVLGNSTLRWSSPTILNDPFDIPRELFPEVSEQQVSTAFAQKLIYEFQNPRDNLDELEPCILEILQGMRQSFPSGISLEMNHRLVDLMSGAVQITDALCALQELKEHWLNTLDTKRVICVSEEPDIIPMWNHYADGYKGIVLEFACLDKLDSIWLIANPINYTDTKPLTYSAEGLAELVSRNNQWATKYLTEELLRIKTINWAYEKEWRVSTIKKNHEVGLYSDYGFHPKELKSVILGHQFDISELPTIIALSQKYPNATIKRAKLTTHRELVLEVIS
ncbi:DUF2971 domain-containing protein [Pantoea endophytica]|uniref:DUF2971 domain-containing protein n=1 Tax=Pantoea endophytica TaxID=92488 RepID=UPI002413C6CA|nr:DUF2971 domain-containing protein [Pantoea endophytica]